MRLKYILACSIVAGVLFLSVLSSAKELNASEFDNILWKQRKYLFVFFYSAKNCENCFPLLLTWVKLGELIGSYPHSQLVIGHVNCDRLPELCAREEIFTTSVAREEEEDGGVNGDEEDPEQQHHQLHPMRRPVMKLYLKRDEELMRIYIKHLLQLNSLDDEDEDGEQTEITYEEENIDMLNLELFLRRRLPKEAIEGPAAGSSFFRGRDDADEADEDAGGGDGGGSGGRGGGGGGDPFAADPDAEEPSEEAAAPDDVTSSDNLVYFYTPTCELCQRLEEKWPTIIRLVKSMRSMRLARVDCASEAVACKYLEVKDYPTVMWISDGYLRRKTKNLDGLSLNAFLFLLKSLLEEIEQLQQRELRLKKFSEAVIKSSISALLEEGETLELGSEDFYSTIKGDEEEDEEDSDSVGGLFFVHFTAPWSRHCRQMVDDWHRLQKKIAQNRQLRSAVKLARVDCSENERLCNAEQIDGYPTLILYRKGGKRLGEYEGGRKTDSFLAYLKHHLFHIEDSSDSPDSSSSSSSPESVTDTDDGLGSHPHHQTDEL
ncbi:Thioredoxin domain-containing protein 5 [Tyrophagus putrescentiae]|nr:Thioredoxin domain-containing protein 5 [Tyrophagus putrescentiae]